jgi:single-strand DNA-binding protein
MKSMKIIGHLGGDAVIKTVNGNSFIEFSVAVNEKYKKASGQEVEELQWFTCTTKNEKLVPFLKKGNPVFVEGNFKLRAYQDNQGAWHSGVDIRAYNIQLLGSKKDEEQEQGITWLTNLIQKEVRRAQASS